MTESTNPLDPFGAGGGAGGFDLGGLLQQAQQLQAQMMQAQQELAETTVEGSVAGVTVTVSGVGDLVGVAIRPGTVDGEDAESLEDLGDLIVAAFRDAKTRAEALAAEKLGPMAGGLGGAGGGLPGGGIPGGPSSLPGGFPGIG